MWIAYSLRRTKSTDPEQLDVNALSIWLSVISLEILVRLKVSRARIKKQHTSQNVCTIAQ